MAQLAQTLLEAIPLLKIDGPILAVVIFVYLIYAYFSCRVRHLPGPFYSKITAFIYNWHGYRNTSNQYVYSLHQRYGPVVRVAPHLISFNSVEAINAIYGARSDFPKPPHVANLDNYGAPNTFSSVANEDHRKRRSRYASILFKSNMVQGPAYEAILERTRKVAQQIGVAADRGKSVDIYRIFHWYALDNAAMVTSGTSMGLLDGNDPAFSEDLREVFLGLAYVYYFPVVELFTSYAPNFLHYLVPEQLRLAVKAHERMQKSNLQHYLTARDITTKEFDKAVSERLRTHKDYNTRTLTEMHVASEVCDQILAGADTLVAGLVYVFWELVKLGHEAYLGRLMDELRSIEWTQDGCPVSYPEIDKLKWLDCCIYEGLRMHMPSGNIQARVVPNPVVTIAGYDIPKETEVGISLYSILLNDEIYEDARTFRPQRWLEANEEPEKMRHMKAAWLTFGTGARACVGKELAMVQIKLLIAMLFHQFSMRMDSAYPEDDMEELQLAVLAPKGGRCMMEFSRLG